MPSSMDSIGGDVAGKECDPFSDADDDVFRKSRDIPVSVDLATLRGSPVSSSKCRQMHARSEWRSGSLVLSASCSSTTSLGRAVFNNTSRRLNPHDGIALLRRSIEVVRNSQNTRTVQQSVRTIRELMVFDYAQASFFLGNGLVEAVCSKLKQHASNAAFAEECCRFIAAIGHRLPEARNIAENSAVVESLRTVMERHFDLYSTAVEAAILALTAMCYQGVSVRRAIRELKCIEWILVCMRQWRDVRILQIAVLRCMHKCVDNEEESKLHAVSLGIFLEIFFTMSQFQQDSSVQSRCIDLLSVLVSCSAEFRRQSVCEGAIKRVVTSLSLFSNKTDVVVSAARSLYIYCKEEESKRLLAAEHGVAFLLNSLQQTVRKEREANSSIHREAILSIINAVHIASVENKANRSESFTLQNMTSTCAAASQYENDHEVIESILRLFKIVCAKTPGKNRELSSKEKPTFDTILRTTADILCRNKRIPRISELACAVLLQVCSAGGAKLIIKSCPHLRSTVQEVVETQTEHESVVKHAISLAMQL